MRLEKSSVTDKRSVEKAATSAALLYKCVNVTAHGWIRVDEPFEGWIQVLFQEKLVFDGKAEKVATKESTLGILPLVAKAFDACLKDGPL